MIDRQHKLPIEVRDKYILENYKSYNLDEVAEYIGMTRTSTARRAKQLGVNMTRRKKEHRRTFVDEHGVTHPNGWVRKTKQEIAEKRSVITKEWLSKNPHPRGFAGHSRSEEWKKEHSKKVRAAWKDKKSGYNKESLRQIRSDNMSKMMVRRMKDLSIGNNYSRAKKGWAIYGDKKYYLKSGWELRYANYLEVLKRGNAIKDWEYEVDTFWFEKIKRGVRSYTPDFKVFYKDGSIEYHEVKGWMDSKSKTKIKRMGIYYPDIKLIVIGEKEMKDIPKL